ncbi:MAG TPA: low molecular weight protein-tyrosine-phosphatase [Terrimesophilobacter sp.]|nr:low molecular weight protein-tyrosine-phosphatase [Terrimesophilobacter sp.]HRP99303.1 low molecular weight protein-tyrosine-phosphatase [Terrimesophilobacter sp.]
MSFGRPQGDSALFRICFVCTGNICRSPMAETVFRDLVAKAGLTESIAVSSAGTGDWHVGESADDRTLHALRFAGYNGEGHRAKQFDPGLFDQFDLVIVFDRSQERILKSWAHAEEDRGKVQLLLGFDPETSGVTDVPDPYFSDAAMFHSVLTTIERACTSLFNQLKPVIRRRTT